MDGWLKELAKYGPLGVVCAVLLYSMIWEIKPAMADIQKQHLELKDAFVRSQEHAAAQEDLSGRAYLLNEKILHVLQVNCANAAKSDDSRARCVQ